MGENRFGNGRKCRLFWLVGKMIERKQQIPSYFFFFLLLLHTTLNRSLNDYYTMYNVQRRYSQTGLVALTYHPDKSTTTFQIHVDLITPLLQYLYLIHRNLLLTYLPTPILALFS